MDRLKRAAMKEQVFWENLKHRVVKEIMFDLVNLALEEVEKKQKVEILCRWKPSW